MFERKDLARIGVEGIALTSGALAAYGWGRARYGPGPHANTLTFLALTSAQLLHALSTRSERHSLFDRGHLERNAYIPLAVGGSLALQCLASLLPAGRRLLGTTPLGFADWIAAAACATGPLLFNEGVKVLVRKDKSSHFIASPRAAIADTAADPAYQRLPGTPSPLQLPPKPGASGFDSPPNIEE